MLVPTSVRRSPMVSKLKALLLGEELLLSHDWIYDSDYFENSIEKPAIFSAGRIADSILSEFKPASIIDVGCGTGALLEALHERGCEVFGLEYADVGLRYCRNRGLNVAKFDLERDVFNESRTFDVAVSMEVAEHLPETVADRYIELLTCLSPIVVFSAAPPGSPGIDTDTDHVNEQPPSYWITKFQKHRFEHLKEVTQCWRDTWKARGDVAPWYHRNLMIFRQVRGD